MKELEILVAACYENEQWETDDEVDEALIVPDEWNEIQPPSIFDQPVSAHPLNSTGASPTKPFPIHPSTVQIWNNSSGIINILFES